MNFNHASFHFISDQCSTEKQLPVAPKEPTYGAADYYSHNEDTFADMEIEMASYRQSQPDPRVPYYHHYPWEKKS